MTHFKFEKSDIAMIATGFFIALAQQISAEYFGIELFQFWFLMLISSACGGYVTLRLFVHFQRSLAEKKGMLREYEDINRVEKKSKW